MGDKEAKIRLGVESGDAVGKLRSVKDELGGFDKMASGLTSTLKGVADGLLRMGTDAARASNGLKAIDFGSAADKYKAADDQLTRMAVRGGKNVDDLKAKFRDFGGQAGVSMTRFASAVKEFDSATLSGVDGAAEAMKSLGTYAEDTDRSIEDMLGLGEAMTTRLGIPAQRVGEELAKIKNIANDMGLASGFLGIERALQRLAPQLGRLQGGATRGAAEYAVLRKSGMGHEQAEEALGSIHSLIQSADPKLLTAAARDAGYKGPIYTRENGRVVVTKKAEQAALRYMVQRPAALPAPLGGGVKGLEAAEALKVLNRSQAEIDRTEEEAIQEERASYALPADFINKGRDTGTKLSKEVAGKRVREEIKEQAVESKVGEQIQKGRDRTNAALTPEQRAIFGTVSKYLPDTAQKVVDVGTAAYSALPNNQPTQQVDALRALPQVIRDAARSGIKEGMKEGLKDANIRVRPDPLGEARREARQGG